MIFDFLVQWSMALIIMSQNKHIAEFFAPNDSELKELLIDLVPVVLVQLASFMGSALGALIGLGMMKRSIPLFLGLQYGLALPAAIYFGVIKGHGVIAFYYAQIFFQASFTVGCIVMLCAMDWHKCATDAKERLAKKDSFIIEER